MNLDVDALLQEAASQMANVSGALASRCALLAGQLAAAQKELADLKNKVEAMATEKLK